MNVYKKKWGREKEQSFVILGIPGARDLGSRSKSLPMAALNLPQYLFSHLYRKGLTQMSSKIPSRFWVLPSRRKCSSILPPLSFPIPTHKLIEEFTAIRDSHRAHKDIQSWDLRTLRLRMAKRRQWERKKAEGRKGRRSHRHIYVHSPPLVQLAKHTSGQ